MVSYDYIAYFLQLWFLASQVLLIAEKPPADASIATRFDRAEAKAQ